MINASHHQRDNFKTANAKTVIPAKAGTHNTEPKSISWRLRQRAMGPRLREDDGFERGGANVF
jgi:hypothetical protein